MVSPRCMDKKDLEGTISQAYEFTCAAYTLVLVLFGHVKSLTQLSSSWLLRELQRLSTKPSAGPNPRCPKENKWVSCSLLVTLLESCAELFLTPPIPWSLRSTS